MPEQEYVPSPTRVLNNGMHKPPGPRKWYSPIKVPERAGGCVFAVQLLMCNYGFQHNLSLGVELWVWEIHWISLSM